MYSGEPGYFRDESAYEQAQELRAKAGDKPYEHDEPTTLALRGLEFAAAGVIPLIPRQEQASTHIPSE